MRILPIILAFLMMISPVLAQVGGWQDDLEDWLDSWNEPLLEPKFKLIEAEDIFPQKGDIRKNIHILFDQSGSISSDEHNNALNRIEGIVSQAFDEYNIKITAFGEGSATLVPNPDDGFQVVKKHPSWMSLPSADNIEKVREWLSEKQVIPDHTRLMTSILVALSEDIEDLTIIIASDCIIDDVDLLTDAINTAQAERIKNGLCSAVIGFINISHVNLADSTGTKVNRLYNLCKPNGWFWVKMLVETEEEEDGQ